MDELVECVNEIVIGNTFLASGLNITPKKNGSAKSSSNYFEDRFLLRKKLTKREQEVLELITKHGVGLKIKYTHDNANNSGEN